jgi:hypothetical protein
MLRGYELMAENGSPITSKSLPNFGDLTISVARRCQKVSVCGFAARFSRLAARHRSRSAANRKSRAAYFKSYFFM